MDTTKRGVRGWKEAQRQGEFADFSNKYKTLILYTPITGENNQRCWQVRELTTPR
jgi:hypothetical protein